MSGQAKDAFAAVGCGLVHKSRVRFWVRDPSQTARELRIEGEGIDHRISVGDLCESRDFTSSILWRVDDCVGYPLPSAAHFSISLISEGGAVLATGEFCAPGRPKGRESRPVAAFGSCHQPFQKDGSLDPGSVDALRAFSSLLRAENPECVVLLGDQMYVDAPASDSLFDQKIEGEGCMKWAASRVRSALHRRYRLHWDVEGWKDILSSHPILPILDDHEIVDNYGASQVHLGEEWASFREGAFGAYRDYQASRIRDDFEAEGPFHYSHQSDGVATFVMDLRSQRLRSEEAPLLGEKQREDIDEFLKGHSTADLIIFAASVPPVHVSKTIAAIGSAVFPNADELSDRWEAPHFQRDRDWFLAKLKEHQGRHRDQFLLILGGDIHVGELSIIEWNDGEGIVPQFISSSISHRPGHLFEFLSVAALKARPKEVFVDGAKVATVASAEGPPAHDNPFTGLNVGLVRLERSEVGSQELVLELYRAKGETAELVFSRRFARPSSTQQGRG